jgi:hypothetical protein
MQRQDVYVHVHVLDEWTCRYHAKMPVKTKLLSHTLACRYGRSVHVKQHHAMHACNTTAIGQNDILKGHLFLSTFLIYNDMTMFCVN